MWWKIKIKTYQCIKQNQSIVEANRRKKSIICLANKIKIPNISLDFLKCNKEYMQRPNLYNLRSRCARKYHIHSILDILLPPRTHIGTRISSDVLNFFIGLQWDLFPLLHYPSPKIKLKIMIIWFHSMPKYYIEVGNFAKVNIVFMFILSRLPSLSKIKKSSYVLASPSLYAWLK